MKKPKVAFVCVHNSCRSQIAEALGKYLSSNVFDSYSAGTETKPQINQDAVRLMKEMYQIDMEKTQYSKLLSESFNRFLIISLDVLICRYSPLFRAFPALFISEEPHKSFYYPSCFRSQK